MRSTNSKTPFETSILNCTQLYLAAGRCFGMLLAVSIFSSSVCIWQFSSATVFTWLDKICMSVACKKNHSLGVSDEQKSPHFNDVARFVHVSVFRRFHPRCVKRLKERLEQLREHCSCGQVSGRPVKDTPSVRSAAALPLIPRVIPAFQLLSRRPPPAVSLASCRKQRWPLGGTTDTQRFVLFMVNK